MCWLPHNTFGRLATTMKTAAQKSDLGEVQAGIM